jgi:hypothetical protein
MNTKRLINKALDLITEGQRIHSAYRATISTLRTECAGMSYDQVRQTIIATIGAYYNVKVVASAKPRFVGEMTLDREAKQFEAAKAALRNITNDILGATAPSKQPKARLSSEAKTVADATIKAVIAAGLSKEEFNAVLAAIKAGVSFK